ncbi:MAG: efflux RND transporter periplasmic adaptor subunit [Parachlamydia sp.]|nr:efflux RND transporter periplasmic adaptor subunit [Parachlamydia sp.]
MRSKLPNIALCFLATAGLAATAYLFFLPKQQGAHAEEEHVHEEFVAMTSEQIEENGILIMVAEPGKVQTVVSAPARILLNQDKVMHLVPKVNGVVHDANKWVGQRIKRGEVLAVFESSEMAVTKSSYLDALKKEALAASNLEREKQLHERQISAVQDFQNAVADQEAARIELELSRQRLHTLGLSRREIDALPDADPTLLRNYELRSPMNGIVIEKTITKGELIDTTREIYVIADPSSLWSEVYLFPTDFALLQEGLELELIHPNGNKSMARPISISPSVDPSTGAVRLIAEFNNSDSDWRQGMYALAELKGKATSVALAVPKEAVQQIEGEPTIFIYKEGGFELRPVKTGLCDHQCIEILFGLAPGESYAAKNTFLLKADHGKDEAEHMD